MPSFHMLEALDLRFVILNKRKTKVSKSKRDYIHFYVKYTTLSGLISYNMKYNIPTYSYMR